MEEVICSKCEEVIVETEGSDYCVYCEHSFNSWFATEVEIFNNAGKNKGNENE